MRIMRLRIGVLIRVLALTATLSLSPGWAQQRPVGQIVGTVRDTQGAFISDCDVKLEDLGTGAQRSTKSGSDGAFVFLNLQPGNYKMTISAKGFRTAVYSEIKVDAARNTDLVASLEVGDIGETVQVVGGAEVLERSSTAIETTVRGDTIRSMPLNNRDTLDFVLLMPGAQHGGMARQSTFLGLPKGAINITMDGVNVQDNMLKSNFGGGMFTIIRPRLDAVEEVTVSTASAGANQTGDGAVQIQFATRRGTNDYHGLVFWDHRNNALNANTWINNVNRLPRQRNLLNVFGGNIGGPIWQNKVFFFFNYEEFRLPETRPRENIILTERASQGFFSYLGTDGTLREINLFSIVPSTDPNNSMDSTVQAMLNAINDARENGAISSFDLFRERYRFDAPSSQLRRFPTLRLDYQISEKLHWHGVWHYNYFTSSPDTLNSMDPTFPGIGTSGGQYSNRYAVSNALQWLVTPTITNEARFGFQGSPLQLFPESDSTMFPAGLRVVWPLTLTSLHVRPGAPGTTRSLPSSRNSPLYSFQDNVSLVRGKHSISFGGGFNILTGIDNSYNNGGFPNVNFGVITGDPIATHLSAANLPSINTTDLANARALYALLTGRISTISGSRNVSEVTKQYSNDPLIQRTKAKGFSLYFQDSHRVSSNLTFNYGLGWQFQGAGYNTNGIYTSPSFQDLWGVSGMGNLFKPGTLSGNANPQIDQRSKNIYERDFNNPSPTFGLSWSPRFENSFLKKIFGGEDKSVIRGGYSISYTREGGNHFTQYAGNSPGLTQSITLSGGSDFDAGTGHLRRQLPEFREFPQSFTFPSPQSQFTFSGVALRTYDPQIKTPYVQSWSFGWQRELSQKTALEIRYVGNHGTKLWRSFNINEVNIFENGFLNDFKNAQTNLAKFRADNPNCGQAGQPACRFGGFSGSIPLPIFDTAFGARGSQAALAAGSGYTNGTFITQLDQGQAGAAANGLAGQAQYLCRLSGNRLAACTSRGFDAAGPFAPNLFQVNPDFAGSSVEYLTNGSSSTYNGLQIEVRRRLSSGLMVNAHYTFSKSLTDLFADSATSTSNFHTLRNPGLNKGPSPFDIRHSFVASWVYELPFGPGRRWRTNIAALDKMIEGWNFLGVMRLQSGRVFRLISGRNTVNTSDSGVILKGMTIGELQEKFKVRRVIGATDIFFVDSDLIGSDGRSNRGTLDVPTMPGELGAFIHLYGPRFVKPDLTLSKKTRVNERVNLEFWAEFFNAFNHQNFMVGAPGAAANTVSIDGTIFGRTTQFFNDLGNQDPGPRMIQFRLRIGF